MLMELQKEITVNLSAFSHNSCDAPVISAQQSTVIAKMSHLAWRIVHCAPKRARGLTGKMETIKVKFEERGRSVTGFLHVSRIQ